jgi:nitrite reductase/ring-hydroxylating ferredoxin subunit
MTETSDVRTLDFVQVARRSEVTADRPKKVVCQGREIALFSVEDRIYATQNSCTHSYASLADGETDDEVVVCPLHSACFDVRTGEVLSGPARLPLVTYEVKVVGEWIQVGLPQDAIH